MRKGQVKDKVEVKRWIVVLGIWLLVVATAGAQTSRFERLFLRSSGQPFTGLTVYLVPQANTYPTGALTCTPHSAQAGVYYRDAVPDGLYKLYYDHGTGPKLVTENFNVGVKVTTGRIDDGAVTLAKISPSLKNYIDASGGGTVTNNPDDVTIVENDGNVLSVAPVLRDSIKNAHIKIANKRVVNVLDHGVVGNGTTNDASAMAAAISEAATGGQVFIPSGMNVKVTGNLSIGKSLTLLLDNSTLRLEGSIVVGADSVTITGTNRTRSVILQTDEEAAGIVVQAGSDFVTIANVTIKGAAREWTYEVPREESNGIQLQGGEETYSRDVLIQNCYFTGNVIDILAQYTRNLTISLNTFSARHTQGIQLNIWGTSYSKVIGNTFETVGSGSAVDAIEFIGNTTPTKGNVIASNTVNGTYTYEVFNLFCLNYSSVIGNTIDITGLNSAAIALSTSGTGQSSTNNTIAGNTIHIHSGSTGSAITLAKCTSCGSSTTFVTDNIISNNTMTIRGSGWGIVVGDSCHRNSITGNKLFVVSPSADAMFVGKARNIDITGNTIRSSVIDSLRYGIFFNATDAATVIRNTFIHTESAIIAGGGSSMALTLVSNIFDSVSTTFAVGSGSVSLLQYGNRLLGGSPPFGLYDAVTLQRNVPWLSSAEVGAIGGIEDGVIVYDKDVNALKVRVNGAWKSVTFDP